MSATEGFNRIHVHADLYPKMSYVEIDGTRLRRIESMTVRMRDGQAPHVTITLESEVDMDGDGEIVAEEEN